MSASALAGGWVVDFPHHDQTQLFALAADVESYPRFIPWCRLARIRRRDGNLLEVDNLFGAGPVQARFRSAAEFDPPHRLDITSRDGPFRHFRLTWVFETIETGGCRVRADYRMELRSGLLHSLARLSLPEMERRVVQNFKDRVRAACGR
ncbi:type II toxin-antitoxin system RatA family toxin [Magnetospirillum sp. SS-4]|uniref:type II toxin-antitoxin system RatA family toxin n=1 Tax=Magnetospirillum sp. SS-4 TaxID=2681465 RepID=UPI0013843D12|nr:type II toxin-antitoxin system RatA family toxin [Magnetospirillum sp. SS-4]CAA7614556.1 Oligoketide cyclase/lipid transport protein [Magnetospirillum sp. SS-4]